MRDVSGVSGTGVVAEGAVWSDGSASLRWPGTHSSAVFWPKGVPAILAIHGHDGATWVRYLQPRHDGPWTYRTGPAGQPPPPADGTPLQEPGGPR